MKLLKKASFAIIFALVFSFTFQCASSKPVTTSPTFVNSTSFKVKPIQFQEWYAGIKVGGTGVNVFVPISDVSDNIEIDSIYFRNLKGKLVKKGSKYVALLENDSPYYTFQIPEKPSDYPFTLTNNECAISFIENGVTKYLKVRDLTEVAGTYYENGPPTIYESATSTILATTDDDDADL
ncbi:hypothetical protein [Winogradskyella vidalii]|uniref:hypothetical protein n=1 Tax=Winogradskyella vidalii TaxID=2615024 RepID=UPI0015CAFF13|nr:hypothetical protein [Winogradskyella vidalii]